MRAGVRVRVRVRVWDRVVSETRAEASAAHAAEACSGAEREACGEPAGRSLCLGWVGFDMLSHVSVALGGMEGGEPCCPYANSGAHL